MKRLLSPAASVSASLKIRSCSGDSVQAGSVLPASPVSAKAWQRQPPKSISFNSQLGHPAGAAIAVESLGVPPDPGNRMIGANRLEFEPGDALGGVAGQHLACG